LQRPPTAAPLRAFTGISFMWLDSVIGVFAPMTAFRRKQARLALSVVSRAYDGAKVVPWTASAVNLCQIGLESA